MTLLFSSPSLPITFPLSTFQAFFQPLLVHSYPFATMNVLFRFYCWAELWYGITCSFFFKQLILLYLCHSVYFTFCSHKWKINTQKALHEFRIKENRCLTKIHVMWNSIMITSFYMVSKNHRLLDQVTHISLIH